MHLNIIIKEREKIFIRRFLAQHQTTTTTNYNLLILIYFKLVFIISLSTILYYQRERACKNKIENEKIKTNTNTNVHKTTQFQNGNYIMRAVFCYMRDDLSALAAASRQQINKQQHRNNYVPKFFLFSLSFFSFYLSPILCDFPYHYFCCIFIFTYIYDTIYTMIYSLHYY